MAQTQRTLAALLAVLPDNSVGNVSAEDVRDIVETLRPDRGTVYVSTPIETVIATVSVPVKALGTTTLESTPAAKNFDMPVSNRLRYIGTAARAVNVQIAASMTTAASNKEVALHVAKNGAVIVSSFMERKTGTSSDKGSAPTFANVDMSNGDYVELFVSNETDNTNLTIERMTMIANGMAL